MKIRVLLNLGTNEYGANALEEGEHDVPEPLAQNLIGRKLAVRVEEVASVQMVAGDSEAVAETQPAVVKPAETNKPVKAKNTSN